MRFQHCPADAVLKAPSRRTKAVENSNVRGDGSIVLILMVDNRIFDDYKFYLIISEFFLNIYSEFWIRRAVTRY